MKAKQFVFGVVSGMLLAAVCVAVVVIFLATQPPSEPEPPLSSPAGDIVVKVAESYLSTLATEMVRSEEQSIEDVAVDLHPDGRLDVFITARVRILNASVGLRLKMLSAVAVEEERLQFSLYNVSFVGLSIPMELLPASLRATIEGMEADWNWRINSALVSYGFVPASVSTDESSITVGLRAQ
jgi:hypothetical protein